MNESVSRSQMVHSKRKISKNLRKRRRQIAKEAAARTLNGNGSSPDLPPLPITTNGSSCDTLFSHRYGALPYGNIYTSNTSNRDEVRHDGLGCFLSTLNDEQVLSILQFLDGKSLGSVVQCSRYLYVAGHHDDIWRDLTLRRYGSVGFTFVKSWRDTFVSSEMEHTKKGYAVVVRGSSDADLSRRTPFKFEPHRPIKMSNIYSDTFFRSWLCRTFTIQKSWLSINNVSTEDSGSITTDKFLQYEESNVPLLIKGATKEWPAYKKWNKNYLIEQTEGISFRATSGAAPLPAQFTIEDYAAYCDEVSEEAPLYLFDRTFAKNCPTLLDDYYKALKKTCPFFDDEAAHGHDLFSLLGKDKRPDHRWIIIGPKRSFSNFHIDPNCTHAWNAPLLGRKRWIFYPPGVNPPGVHPSPNGDDVVMPISLGEWFLTHYNDHVRQRNNPDVKKRPLECTVYPGDILFVPHGWWHCVLNLDDGMSVALTQNYVSRSNLPDVLRFLKMKPQQISGCRDRPEAIQPEDLLHAFTSRLQQCRPDLLLVAQSLADTKWQCAAWGDDNEEEQTQEKQSPHNKKKLKTLSQSIVQQAKSNNATNSDNQTRKDNGTTAHASQFTFSFLQ
mmetsp:Transcript_26744/g.40152  ORF Transcript_26744/g.40152 Transcript_26744/m.40152 type:complete len:612 (+) Transcript_26744:20-1855(+)